MKVFFPIMFAIVLALLALIVFSDTEKVAKKSTPEITTEHWINADEVVFKDGVQIRITKVSVGLVDIKGITTNKSSDKFLSISLEIKNINSTKAVNYNGWGARTFDSSDKNRALLKDDCGNFYNRIYFEFNAPVIGQIVESTDIHPNESITDVLIFEKPFANSKYLFLELPASTFGSVGMVKIQIPKKIWKK